jgi:multicomponent Na+:H+ antiporter subunit E
VSGPGSSARVLQLAVATSRRAVVLAFCWWALTEGEGLWSYGSVLVVAATAVSLLLRPPPVDRRERAGVGGRFVGSLLLLPWFVGRSLVGSLDVARRAMARPLDLDTGLVDVVLRLPPGDARLVVVDAVSLMPGTLSADLDGDLLRVHTLDVGTDVPAQVAALESRIARAAGVGLSD